MVSAKFFSLVLLSAVVPAYHALPANVPLTLSKGFWFGDFTIGSQEFTLYVDTGSFPVLINKGDWQPGGSSDQTALGETVQLNAVSQDGTASAEETVSFVQDVVTFGGASAQSFLVGNITSGPALPGDGVAGFSPPALNTSTAATYSNGQGFIETLCQDGVLSPCQFGLVLGTNGKGYLAFGEMDTTKIEGEITTLASRKNTSWTFDQVPGTDAPGFVLDPPGNAFVYPYTITFASGTPNVIGSFEELLAAFSSLGYNTSQQTNNGVSTVLGTYDCSSQPALFGFTFPPSTTVHYIDTAANVLNTTADGKVCTANVLGSSAVGPGKYIIGQTWFQGRYVQHDLDRFTISFADLASPTV